MLAILAKVNNWKFETVYYYVRCLSSRNPFQSSKEGIVTIFEEMKRRWEIGEKKRVEERKEGEREREGKRRKGKEGNLGETRRRGGEKTSQNYFCTEWRGRGY